MTSWWITTEDPYFKPKKFSFFLVSTTLLHLPTYKEGCFVRTQSS